MEVEVVVEREEGKDGYREEKKRGLRIFWGTFLLFGFLNGGGGRVIH